MTTVLIGGDVCPTARNAAMFERGRADRLFNDLLPNLENADLAVVNLECPLITHKSPIRRSGGVLGASVGCVNALRKARIGAVNLANNHILDHGEDGLRSTVAALGDAHIDSFGAGANLDEAGQLYVRTIKGTRIAFLGVAEHEFSIATKKSWGANPLDIIEIVRCLRATRAHSIASLSSSMVAPSIIHSSPRLQKVCRFLVEEGPRRSSASIPIVLGATNITKMPRLYMAREI